MASNFLSRFMPPSTGSPSIYETLRQQDDATDTSDIEAHPRTASRRAATSQRFQAYNTDNPNTAKSEDSQLSNESTASLLRQDLERGNTDDGRAQTRPRWMAASSALHHAQHEGEDGDDEVPASLLVEGNDVIHLNPRKHAQAQDVAQASEPPIAGPATTEIAARWQTTQGQQPLHTNDRTAPLNRRSVLGMNMPLGVVSSRERAENRWASVVNLDNFLKEVYEYYLGNGIWSILLSRILYILTVTFVIGFSTFLTSCIDYSKVRESKSMPQILVPQCSKKMSSSKNLVLWLVAFWLLFQVFELVRYVDRLKVMHDFYLYLLKIPDLELQTISWQEVVGRLMALRDKNPVTANVPQSHRKFLLGAQSKQRMDAHDIANRLMRKENYLIALFNKDILDLTLPIPFLRNRQLFSKALEWNLSMCIIDYVFNEEGQVRPLFTKASHRRALSDGLRRRFIFAGFMNIICAPFIITYCIAHFFLRYFTEYQRNPSQIGSRQYTPYAEWKFREFNELWHLFQRRTNMSYPFASRYVDQFPKDKTVQLSRFVAFIAGALASVLALASVIDPELFLGFEITPDRTVLFYLGLFGTVWAVARGAVPEETLVFDPEYALREVIDYTHYFPSHWRGRLHSDEVKKEFSQLYQMKIVIFLEEILSLVFTPFVLWFSLPDCSDRLIDFFREFTISVDGLGRICSFAEFDFQKVGNNIAHPKSTGDESGHGLREDYYATKDGKMLASYFGFLDNYATNPKPGAPYMYHTSKRTHHPPPTSNGLTSPELAVNNSINRARQSRPSPVQRGMGRSTAIAPNNASGHRNIRNIQPSPMPSILLDPHHQPSASGFRTAMGTASRYHGTGVAPIRDEENTVTGRGGRSSKVEVQDSPGSSGNEKLDGPWKTTEAAVPDDDSEDEDAADAIGENGAGVLGLLYQLQQAQTGPRAGVGL